MLVFTDANAISNKSTQLATFNEALKLSDHLEDR